MTARPPEASMSRLVIVEDRAGEPFGTRLVGIALVDRIYGFGWAGNEVLYLPIDGAARGPLAGDAALVAEVGRRYTASIQRAEIAARPVWNFAEEVARDDELSFHDDLEVAARAASGVRFGDEVPA